MHTLTAHYFEWPINWSCKISLYRRLFVHACPQSTWPAILNLLSFFCSSQSFDKQGFHTGTPPPFSLPSALGGTGPLNPGGAPGYAPAPFLHILPPHQQPHSQLLHHHLTQDGQVNWNFYARHIFAQPLFHKNLHQSIFKGRCWIILSIFWIVWHWFSRQRCANKQEWIICALTCISAMFSNLTDLVDQIVPRIIFAQELSRALNPGSIGSLQLHYWCVHLKVPDNVPSARRSQWTTWEIK